MIEVAERKLKDLAIGSDTARESTGPVSVERTIEPTILAGGQVLLPGKVLLKET